MPAHFCSVSGVRIAAPGVSKKIDPANGQDEFNEELPSAPKADGDKKPADKAAKKDK